MQTAAATAEPSVTVSIINYNTGRLTIQCVTSVLEEIAAMGAVGRGIGVVVVDNCSDDGSADEIAAWIDGQRDIPVRLVRSATNSGFSGGHNQGMAARPAAFYLILNSDAVLKPGFFAAVLAAAAAAPKTGLFAPRIDYDDGGTQVSCFRHHGPTSELIRAAETGPVTKLFRSRDVPLTMPPEPDQIEWASFACIMIRHAVLAEIGPMDEGYFLYYEDADYCLSATRAGWGISYVDTARAVHFRGGSGPVKSLAAARKRLPKYYYASRTRFLTKAHGRAGMILANLAWHLGRTIAQARRLTGRPVPMTVECEAQDIWTQAAHPLKPWRPTATDLVPGALTP